MQAIDLTGKKYGKWTVIKRVENSASGQARWLCRCECGNEKVVFGGNLREGKSLSCGCEHYKNMSDIYGLHYKEPQRLYNIWANMKYRCTKPSNPSYERYGGRGICVCDEWLHSFVAFRTWAFANGYANDLTLDRIDNDGDYCPENCRWATPKEQSNNRRSNVRIEFNGETHNLSEWREKIGITKSAMDSRRARGWSVERMLTQPMRERNRSVEEG